MPEYRFYFITVDGHVFGPPHLDDAPSDGEAIQRAKQRMNGHDIEVWQGERIVAYLVPDRAGDDQAPPEIGGAPA